MIQPQPNGGSGRTRCWSRDSVPPLPRDRIAWHRVNQFFGEDNVELIVK